jgi:hypothetical protein
LAAERPRRLGKEGLSLRQTASPGSVDRCESLIAHVRIGGERCSTARYLWKLAAELHRGCFQRTLRVADAQQMTLAQSSTRNQVTGCGSMQSDSTLAKAGQTPVERCRC